MKRERVAIAGLTGCSGCQLTLLDCEDELPLLLKNADFDYFPMASSGIALKGEYDAALVEGCLSTQEGLKLLRNLREKSRLLVAFGACAVSGGVTAIRNDVPREELSRIVYGGDAVPGGGFEPAPLASAVKVDFDITGCPPEKADILEFFAGLSAGVLPIPARTFVCADCRARENICLLAEKGELCLGVLTRGGCNARCPSMNVPCEGCRGVAEETNFAEAMAIFSANGFSADRISEKGGRFFREFLHEKKEYQKTDPD